MKRPRIETLLVLAGVVLLAWSATDRVRAYVYQARAERELESMIGRARSAATVDERQSTDATRAEKPAPGEARRVVAVGVSHERPVGLRRASATRSPRGVPKSAASKNARPRVIGRFEIPRLGIRAMIADGTDAKTLSRAIGHLSHTPLPGERGNVALAAHRDTYFKPLRDVRPRDVIRITTPDGVYAYRVDWTKVVEPERTDLLRPAKRSELTLITCYPFDAIGPAPRRFVVRAVAIGRESPARS